MLVRQDLTNSANALSLKFSSFKLSHSLMHLLFQSTKTHSLEKANNHKRSCQKSEYFGCDCFQGIEKLQRNK